MAREDEEKTFSLRGLFGASPYRRRGAEGDVDARETPAHDLGQLRAALEPAPENGAAAAVAQPVMHGRLSPILDSSVDSIRKRYQELDDHRRALAAEVAIRDRGETSARAQRWRAAIAVLWLAVAAFYGIGGLAAEANQTASFRGMPITDAYTLYDLFGRVGLVGLLGVAVFSGWLTMRGMTGDDRLRQQGGALGDKLAKLAGVFNRTLGDYRDRIVDRECSPDALLEDVSRAHLVALEAKLLFARVDFLTLLDKGQAERRFERFLAPSLLRGYTGADALAFFLIGLVIGVSASFPMVGLSFSVASDFLAAAAPALEKYPLLLTGFVASVTLYAFAGLFARLSAALPASAGAVSRARRLTLDAVRSSFTAAKAPRPDEVILQVEDIVEILRARLGPAARRGLESESDVRAQNSGEPAWRRPQEGPRFVETGFQATPKQWNAAPVTEISADSAHERPATKRRFFTIDAKRRH